MLLPHTRLRSATQESDGGDGARRTWSLAAKCSAGVERKTAQGPRGVHEDCSGEVLSRDRSVTTCAFWVSIPARAVAPRRSGRGSSFGREHHESQLISFLHVRPRGCTTCGPGYSPGVLLAPLYTYSQVSQKPAHLLALLPDSTRTTPSGRFAEPPLRGDTTCRGWFGLPRAPALRPLQTTASLADSPGEPPCLRNTVGRDCFEQMRLLLRLPCGVLSQWPRIRRAYS